VTSVQAGPPRSTAARDLDSRAEIHDLVVAFYREVVFDDVLAPVFGEVAEVDWATHIPKLIDYWCRVLLGEPGYEGTILAAHRHVHDIDPFRLEHFDRWFSLWVETIDQRWHGPMADSAVAHAARIGAVLARRLLGTEWRSAQDVVAGSWRTGRRRSSADTPVPSTSTDN
jgi:hemoglobin